MDSVKKEKNKKSLYGLSIYLDSYDASVGASGGVGRVGNGVNHHCLNVRASACILVMAVSRTERSKIDQSPTTRVSSFAFGINLPE